MLSPVASPSPSIAPAGPLNADLLIATAKAEQSRIVGEVVEASIDRMAENRERREEERLEEDRETDRLRAIERREKADADRTVRNAERREAEFAARADRGEERSRARNEIDANRERGRAGDARRRSRGARLDIRA